MTSPDSNPRSRSAGGRAKDAPSIQTVARQAGVSTATVSRVVNGIENKASADTVRRVRAVIDELGYRPSGAGSALRSRQSRIVALLVPNAANPHMAAIAASVETALRQRRLVMILCDTREDPAIQDEYLLEMRAQMVRGIALLGAVDSPVLDQVLDRGEAVVFVNRHATRSAEQAFVGIADRQAGADIAQYFLDRDIAPVGIVHGPLSSSATADRVAGFRERMRGNGAAVPRALISGGADVDHLAIGYRGAGRVLGREPRPRGLFCGSDLIAYGAQRWCREHGLRVPDDVVLFGFDDNPLNDWVAPWINSVRVPYENFGPAVLDVFDRIWSGEPHDRPFEARLPYEMVLRSESAVSRPRR